MSELKWWQTTVFIKFFRFVRVTNNPIVLVVLNSSEKQLELDFSRIKELNGKELNILFSSAERSVMVKSPRELVISPFEAFIAEVQPKES